VHDASCSSSPTLDLPLSTTVGTIGVSSTLTIGTINVGARILALEEQNSIVGVRHIRVSGGVQQHNSADRSFLSASTSGQGVSMWISDDGSNRQRWSITAIVGTSHYNIRILGGTETGNLFLASDTDGQPVNLYSHDEMHTSSPLLRERWSIIRQSDGYFTIEIAGDVTPTNLRYMTSAADGHSLSLTSSIVDRAKWFFS